MSSEIPNPPKADKFDRAIGALTGLPDTIHTAPTTVRSTSPIVGTAQTFIVQTFRQRDSENGSSDETVFLEYIDDEGAKRIVIPPKVVRVILRQHDSLTGRARTAAGKANAAERKARGLLPGFMKGKGKVKV